MHIEKRNNIWHLHFYIIIEKYHFCIFNFYWKCIMYLHNIYVCTVYIYYVYIKDIFFKYLHVYIYININDIIYKYI